MTVQGPAFINMMTIMQDLGNSDISYTSDNFSDNSGSPIFPTISELLEISELSEYRKILSEILGFPRSWICMNMMCPPWYIMADFGLPLTLIGHMRGLAKLAKSKIAHLS